MTAETTPRSAEAQIRLDGEIPEAYQRRRRPLRDVARRPTENPLATAATAVVFAAFASLAVTVWATYHPLVALLVVLTVAAAYVLSTWFWTIQHDHMVRELAKEGELDRLQK